MRKIKFLFIGFLFLTGTLSFKQAIYTGIPSNVFNYYAAGQTKANWCWAASIQMVFNYYGVYIVQNDIVRRSYGVDPYGNLPDWAGSFEIITANLNNWSVDYSGRTYAVVSQLNWGAPTPSYLVSELNAQRPVLIGYKSSGSIGHAVVITACSYIQTNNGPFIQSIVVRDPWPSAENIANAGRVEYPANFANLIQAHWYIRVY